MTKQAQAVRGIRTGGRSARVRAAVLAATIEEFVGSGYVELSIEGIAARAGVNKTTIYRRWADREALLVDALSDWSDSTVSAPDTGSIEHDLVALTDSVVDLLNSDLGRAVVGTVAAARDRNPELVDATMRFLAARGELVTPLVLRGIARGELPVDTDVAALLATLRAPLYYRIITTGEQLDETHAGESVAVALAAVRAGLLRTPDAGQST